MGGEGSPPPPGGGSMHKSNKSMTYGKQCRANSSFQMSYRQIRLSKRVSGAAEGEAGDSRRSFLYPLYPV